MRSACGAFYKEVHTIFCFHSLPMNKPMYVCCHNLWLQTLRKSNCESATNFHDEVKVQEQVGCQWSVLVSTEIQANQFCALHHWTRVIILAALSAVWSYDSARQRSDCLITEGTKRWFCQDGLVSVYIVSLTDIEYCCEMFSTLQEVFTFRPSTKQRAWKGHHIPIRHLLIRSVENLGLTHFVTCMTLLASRRDLQRRDQEGPE